MIHEKLQYVNIFNTLLQVPLIIKLKNKTNFMCKLEKTYNQSSMCTFHVAITVFILIYQSFLYVSYIHCQEINFLNLIIFHLYLFLL